MPDGVTPGPAESRPRQRRVKTRLVRRLRRPLRRLARRRPCPRSARVPRTPRPRRRGCPSPLSRFQLPLPLAVSFSTRITDAVAQPRVGGRTSAAAPATCGRGHRGARPGTRSGESPSSVARQKKHGDSAGLGRLAGLDDRRRGGEGREDAGWSVRVGVAERGERDLRSAAREGRPPAGAVGGRDDQAAALLEWSPVPVGWRSLAGWPFSTPPLSEAAAISTTSWRHA